MRAEVVSFALWVTVSLAVGQVASVPAASPAPAAVPKNVSIYLAAPYANFEALLPAPPALDSAAGAADMAAVHRAEQARTPEEAAAAKYDDQHEDIFLYADVLGSQFNAARLPVTAALGVHLRHEVGAVDPPLKQHFARPRPFLSDKTLHPMCELSKGGSYPSGHSMNGYVYGLALAQMLPNRAEAILARAHAYAQHRVTCGVHYPTDTEASRTLSLVLFGELMSNDKFRAELGQAREELRKGLQ